MAQQGEAHWGAALADLRLLLSPGQLPGLHNITRFLPEVALFQNFLPDKIQSHDEQHLERYKN